MKRIPILATLAAIIFALCVVPAFASDGPNEPIMKPSDDASWKLDFTQAEMIAVQEGRRKKPLQTFAFETVEQIVGRPLIGATFYRDPSTGKDMPDGKDLSNCAKLNAMDLYLSIWFFPPYWYDKPIILVSNSDLRKKLIPPIGVMGADACGYAGRDREMYFDEKRLSIRELARSPLKDILLATKGKSDDDQSALEKDAKLVSVRMQMVNRIAASDEELAMVPFPFERVQGDAEANQKKLDQALQGTWASLLDLAGVNSPKLNKAMFPYNTDSARKTIDAYVAFRDSYRSRDAAAFSTASKNFRDALQALSPDVYPTDSKLGVEVQYNNERPFARAWILYLFAAILALFASRNKNKPLYYGAMAFYLLGLGLHIYGFTLRCIIAGRPPVSNMYESVIWVGFGAVLFGLIFELIYRTRLYVLAGSTAGFLCLILMDMVPVLVGNNETPGFEASIKPLQPVLRDNFWLTVHVLTITLSYAAFMLAWAMGHISLFSHLFNPTARKEHRELHTLVYRVIQVGTLLLSIGTILGGVWAYYSWGRFWGWDPKETWAFIALMCYIVVLHGRFAGMWTNFGLAFGSVFCFLSIVMAWYGVNFVLGKGLHSYGSGAGGMVPVSICVGIDLAFLAVATFQYVRYRDMNKTAASAAHDEDEDQSARGRAPEKPTELKPQISN
ncbi:MAG: cytochrome c biogenesis protein CcsA [Planctomycetota bacterium]